jgi:hypothetical protein
MKWVTTICLSREGGDPVVEPLTLDSRLRGNDKTLGSQIHIPFDALQFLWLRFIQGMGEYKEDNVWPCQLD